MYDLDANLEEHFPRSFDNTTLSTFQTCPKKFQYRILKGLVPRTHARSLDFGAAIHLGLESWYTNQRTPEDAMRAKLKAVQEKIIALGDYQIIMPDVETMQPALLRVELAIAEAMTVLPPLADHALDDTRDVGLLAAMLRGYAIKYKYEPFAVVHVEKNFIFLLPDGSPYSGIMDLVIEAKDGIQPFEHKTTRALYNFGDQFTPNQQVSGYIKGCKVSVPNASNHATINALLVNRRKDRAVKSEDFQRFPYIARSDESLEEFERTAVLTIEEMHESLEKQSFRMNTTACHHYSGCPYRQICGASPGPERETIAAAFYDQKFWDPLHRDDERKEQKQFARDEV